MSRGPGQIEQRIAELFVSAPDRALSVAEIADHAFALGGHPASRAQRLSAVRAAHRLLRRVRDTAAKAETLSARADENTKAALGREEKPSGDPEYRARLAADPAWRAAERLDKRFLALRGRMHIRRVAGRTGWLRVEFDPWRTTTIGRGRAAKLWFHRPDVPVQVWAVAIDRGGIHWFDAEVVRTTERNVMVRYAGELARLDRTTLWRHWAWWRGVMFVSGRTGRIAERLDAIWRDRYGAAGKPAAGHGDCRSPRLSPCSACRRITPQRTSRLASAAP